LANSRIDSPVCEGAAQSPIEPFIYARSRLGKTPTVLSAVAEPFPPGPDDGVVPVDAADRLERCLHLQARAISLLEGETFSGEKSVALLETAMQYGRMLSQDIRALQEEIGSLRAERDALTVALRHAEALSITDDLTGLANRRAFLQRLDQEISRSVRTGQPLSVVLLDMDNFKDINDRFGHHVGDRVLHSFAQRITQEFRQHDLSARYGGEEFVLMFPVTWQDEARNALEKLRRRIRHEPLEVGGITIGLPTFSAGIAGLRPGESATTLLNRADQALYRAKRLGRNRTESDEPLPARPHP